MLIETGWRLGFGFGKESVEGFLRRRFSGPKVLMDALNPVISTGFSTSYDVRSQGVFSKEDPSIMRRKVEDWVRQWFS